MAPRRWRDRRTPAAACHRGDGAIIPGVLVIDPPHLLL